MSNNNCTKQEPLKWRGAYDKEFPKQSAEALLGKE